MCNLLEHLPHTNKFEKQSIIGKVNMSYPSKFHVQVTVIHTGESTFIADSCILMKFPVYDWLKLSFVLIVVSLVVLWYLEFVSQFYCVFVYFYLVSDLCKKTFFSL